MKNILALGVVAALGLSSAAMAGLQVVDSTAVGGAIPDNSTAGLVMTLEGSGGVIQSFDWTSINGLSHTWSGDLAVSLEHGGTTVWLMNRVGLTPAPVSPVLGECCGNSGDMLGLDYYFQDGGAAQPTVGDWVNGGLANAYDPSGNGDGTGTDLSAFDGMDSAGTWTMSIYDGAGLDFGSAGGFSIAYTLVPAPGAFALLGLAGLTTRRRRR